jgi:hypothetical protein
MLITTPGGILFVLRSSFFALKFAGVDPPAARQPQPSAPRLVDLLPEVKRLHNTIRRKNAVYMEKYGYS